MRDRHRPLCLPAGGSAEAAPARRRPAGGELAERRRRGVLTPLGVIPGKLRSSATRDPSGNVARWIPALPRSGVGRDDGRHKMNLLRSAVLARSATFCRTYAASIVSVVPALWKAVKQI